MIIGLEIDEIRNLLELLQSQNQDSRQLQRKLKNTLKSMNAVNAIEEEKPAMDTSTYGYILSFQLEGAEECFFSAEPLTARLYAAQSIVSLITTMYRKNVNVSMTFNIHKVVISTDHVFPDPIYIERFQPKTHNFFDWSSLPQSGLGEIVDNGMGATQIVGSERYAYTVIAVTGTNTIVIQSDTCIAVGGKQNGNQQYTYEPNPKGSLVTLKRLHDGRWVEDVKRGSESPCAYIVGKRQHYYDHSF